MKILNCLQTIDQSPFFQVFPKYCPERLMYNRLYNFLADHNIISKKQYGFRENYSTYMAIIDLVDKISSNIDNKKHSIGIFLDLSKAFDTIDHQILLRKLQCYGIRGIACDWFKRYLENRVQYVSYTCNTKDSDFMKISDHPSYTTTPM